MALPPGTMVGEEGSSLMKGVKNIASMSDDAYLALRNNREQAEPAVAAPEPAGSGGVLETVTPAVNVVGSVAGAVGMGTFLVPLVGGVLGKGISWLGKKGLPAGQSVGDALQKPGKFLDRDSK